MTRLTPDQQLYVIQSQSVPATFTAFAGYTLASLLVGLAGRQAGFGTLNTGITVLALLAGILNAALTLGLFPWLFTWISRRYGSASETHEVRAITALSLMPVIVTTLLTLLVGGVLPLALLGSVFAFAIFVHGLALANGVTHLAALRHTFAVFGTLVLALTALSVVLTLVSPR